MPVSLKAAKYGAPIDLGDALRQFDIAEPFILALGFWEQDGDEKRFVNLVAPRIELAAWRKLWAPVTRADLERLDAVIKNKSLTPEEARAAAKKIKNAPPFTSAIIEVNPKIDSKTQRRLQCSLRFDDVFKYLAPPRPIRCRRIDRRCGVSNFRVPSPRSRGRSRRSREPRRRGVASTAPGRCTFFMLTKAALQRLRSLREKKHREALGLFVVEGEKVVAELLGANFSFAEIYATPAWSGAKTHPISEEQMLRVSQFPAPSSVLAVGKIVRLPLAPGVLDRGLTLALDGVQDAGNVGTLLRIADWFAFDRVVLSPDCADLFHQKVINASMGSFARVTAHTADLAAALAATTAPILGCELAGDDVHALPALRDAVVVIGSEGRGLSSDVAARVTRRVTIPKFGDAESLNAATAAAIVCDNLRRAQARA